jgi:ferric-dicitrate binding protein FerR (iron transport regulator)
MAKEDLHSEFDRLLSSYLSGELNPEEQEHLEEEIRKDPGKQKLLEEYRRIWDSAVPDQSYDLDAEWALMQSKLPGFKTDSGRGKVRSLHRSVSFYTYRIAAVLILGLVFTFSWMYISRVAGTVRVVAEEQAVEVILEDGTEVTVNRNSVLRYPKSFDRGVRKVYLSGEAWSDVARDTSRGFVIDAGAALVEVLGTRFNVNAYRENPTVEITVESGLVALSAKADQQDQIVMKAGAGGSYDKSLKQLKLIPASDPNSISWKTRELFFDATRLSEVCADINKVYGVQMVIMNEELASCPLTVTFRDQSLESVLKVLESTLDLQISREGDLIRLDGEGCAD